MIKSLLPARMGQWQAEHNQALLVPDLAEKTGLSPDFLYRLYNNTIKRLDLDKLEVLCTFFSCTPNDLLWVETDSE